MYFDPLSEELCSSILFCRSMATPVYSVLSEHFAMYTKNIK